jgi:hypothetical protein
MAGKIYNPKYPGLYYFDTFTFTTLGTSGKRGPDSTKGYANAPWSEDQFSIVNGQQQWTVPASGTYLIEAAGAYAAAPGRVVSGEVNLSEGQVVSLLVGQLPSPFGAGGGGGTFVTSGGKPLIVASGGDGTGGHAASFLPSGTGTGGSGAGYYGNGSQTNSSLPFLVPIAYVNGGFGNSNVYTNSDGGFGGGQCPYGIGGGGYTGSPGNGVSGATCYAYASVTNFTDLGASSNSAGYVTVSLIDPPPITLVYDDTIVGSEIYVSPSGFAYWSDIAYSPELKIFVAPSSFYNGQGIAYSTDGKQWFRSDYEGAGPLALSWSPELGIFITGTNYRIYTSFNGKNWTLASFVDFSGFIDVIWVQFLHEFICITTIDNYSSFYKSSDGINWYPITVSPPVYYGDYGHSVFAASPDTVIACLSTSVYLSTDGVNWDTALTTSNNILATAYGNGILFVITYLVEPNTFTYYYSTDKGQTWSNGTLTFNYVYVFKVSVVFTDSSVIVTGANETFVSNDCITWTLYPNNTIIEAQGNGGYNSAVYNPLDKYIVAVSDREINLTLDGSIWVPADTTFIGGPYDNVAYSPETNTVVAVASNGQISTETGIYTKDGVNWKRIPGLYFNPVMCKWNPLQNLFFLGSNNLCFDPFSERIVQSSYSEWIEPTTPPQLLQSYYQQGLNNNLPIGKAFSLSGIIVDTGANGYGGDRVSCSGDVFIKMARYPYGTVYTSADGINWEPYQLQGDIPYECNRIIYVSKYKAFFSLSGQEGRVYKSYDSVNWSTVYQSPGIYLYDMLWCSTMNKLLLFSIANNLTELTFSN